MTPGEYIRGVRETERVTLDELALALDSTPPVSHRARVDLLWAIEADFVPVSLTTAIVLSAILPIDIDRLSDLVDRYPVDAIPLPRLRRAGGPVHGDTPPAADAAAA